MSNPRITIAQINTAIENLGGKERLVCGKFCYYFADGDAAKWPSSSVPVFRLNHWTLEEWITEYKQLKAAYEADT